jgi:hypothetical protein
MRTKKQEPEVAEITPTSSRGNEAPMVISPGRLVRLFAGITRRRTAKGDGRSSSGEELARQLGDREPQDPDAGRIG